MSVIEDIENSAVIRVFLLIAMSDLFAFRRLVEDVHEGKDLGRELGNDFTEITPVLRVRERGEDVRNALWYRAASTRKRRIRLPTCREPETRTLVSASG